MYAVATFTHGVFAGWCTEPGSLTEAQQFVANPPECWAPRRQDRLIIFELTEVCPDAD